LSLLNDITKKMGDAAKTVGDAAKSAAKKSEEMLEVSKLNREISSEENKIEKINNELGKIVYNKYKASGNIDDELSGGCKQIDELENNIASIKEKIEEIKHKEELEKLSNQAEEKGLKMHGADNTEDQAAPTEEPLEDEGQSVKKFCPNCGEKLTDATKFCPNCGGRL
jgi:rubrerythrin